MTGPVVSTPTGIYWRAVQILGRTPGIPSAEAFGTLTVGVPIIAIQPNGIVSQQTFGTLKTVINAKPTGIASNQAFGTPKVNESVTLAGNIASQQVFGTPTMRPGSVAITAAGGIPSAEAFGTPEVYKMSITGTNGSTTTTVTIPAHKVGDIIVIAATRYSGATVPTKPAASGTVPAWVDIDAANGTNAPGLRTAYFVATANNHTSGTWTGATGGMVAVVIRGNAPATPYGGHAKAESYLAAHQGQAPAVTLTNTDGSSILLHFFTINSVAYTWDAAPAGYTQLYGASTYICCDSKNVTTTDGSVIHTNGYYLAFYCAGATVEIKNH